MTAPSWIPYNGSAHAGFCDVCRRVATWALVRLRDDVAVSLLRTACDAHAPATAKRKADDPEDPYRHFPKRPVVER